MPRVLVDLPNTQIEKLAVMVQVEQRSRASIIRAALEIYLAQHKPAPTSEVFGLWKDKKVDGLAYQQALRSEW